MKTTMSLTIVSALIASIGALMTPAAHADGWSDPYRIAAEGLNSTRQRAQVRMDATASGQSNAITNTETEFDRWLYSLPKSTLTRAQVAAEAREAVQARASMHSSESEFDRWLTAQPTSSLTRDHVAAEARKAVRDGVSRFNGESLPMPNAPHVVPVADTAVASR